MAIAHYTAEVRENLLLELPGDAAELHLRPGDKVLIQINRVAGTDTPVNMASDSMAYALRVISDRQDGRRYTDAAGSDALLREARAGAMWGCSPIE